MNEGMTRRRTRCIINGRACWTECTLSDELRGIPEFDALIAEDTARALSRLSESRWGNGKLIHLRGNEYKWIPLDKLIT